MKVAILIDGGYFLKKYGPKQLKQENNKSEYIDSAAEDTNNTVKYLIEHHLNKINKNYCLFSVENQNALLYRCFYYDATPYPKKGHSPIEKKAIDFSKTVHAKFRLAFFDRLQRNPNFAVRLGEVKLEHSGRLWVLKEEAQKDILNKTRQVTDLKDDDFAPGFRQKAVDMRIGIDIASIALKKQADIIVLVTGDSDFVPAAKLARTEGVRFIIDSLGQKVDNTLLEHIDDLWHGLGANKPDANKPND
ncbi:NYN domain-containing protein [Azospirillaceae bacterium]